MAGDTSQEKTEEATPRKRQQARKKGTVAKSVELSNAIVLGGLLIAMPAAFSSLAAGFSQSLHLGLNTLPATFTLPNVAHQFIACATPVLPGFGMVVIVAMVLGVASTTAQVGFVLSTEALHFNLAKLNPLTGVQRLFSAAPLFEALKAAAKSFIFGFLAWGVLAASWNKMLALGWMPPQSALVVTGEIGRTIAMRIAMLWLALAGLDYFFQRQRINKQLRMTKEEVKKEMKDMEQSPEVKMAFMRARRKMARGRMMDAVKTADVIITNPTHFAVAISYDSEKSPAPLVVAKGQDLLALRIREVAREHEVPIVENPPLARALYKRCEIGDLIPNELFQPVAEVLAFVYKTIRKVRTATGAAR